MPVGYLLGPTVDFMVSLVVIPLSCKRLPTPSCASRQEPIVFIIKSIIMGQYAGFSLSFTSLPRFYAYLSYVARCLPLIIHHKISVKYNY